MCFFRCGFCSFRNFRLQANCDRLKPVPPGLGALGRALHPAFLLCCETGDSPHPRFLREHRRGPERTWPPLRMTAGALVEVGCLFAHAEYPTFIVARQHERPAAVHYPLSTTHYALYPSLMVARPTISFSLCAPTSLSSISWCEETPYTHLSRYAGMRPRSVEATTSITWGTSEA